MNDRIENILKSVFGFSGFRPLQREIIGSLLEGNDTQAVIPTGGGKSLTYQIPALIFPGLTVVVSPLISLMQDQIEQLRELGIPAGVLNSSLSDDAYRRSIADILNDKYRLLYMAPESLMRSKNLNLLRQKTISCITIDEAHCISEWGHDFRPEYRQLIELRKHFPSAVCLALTATATPVVQKDIASNLDFKNHNLFLGGFDRENLFLEFRERHNLKTQMLSFVRRFSGESGIVYCLTRDKAERVAETLRESKINALSYHAGLDAAERERRQEAFRRDDVRVIAATIAFGMGIDKPNVRFVLHVGMPKSVEAYYQQIGRAGRDGLPASCLLLYSYADLHMIRYWIDKCEDAQERANGKRHLDALLALVHTSDCRRKELLSYFGEKYSDTNCFACDNCVETTLAEEDMSVPAQMLLSCFARTNCEYPLGYVIKVLRGSKGKTILLNQHDKLSTYGIGKRFKEEEWQSLAHFLFKKGGLSRRGGGLAQLNSHSWEIMRGEKDFHAPLTMIVHKPEQSRENSSLFEALRIKRKELADESGVPPYVIFSDRTLRDMAELQPKTSGEMMNVNGVGKVKFERYGEIFLRVLEEA